MVSKRDGVVVVWPSYFERDRSRSEGRRVPRDLAVDRPDPEAIRDAAAEAGFAAAVEEDARHPSRPWEAEGRVLVEGVQDKEALLKEIGEQLADGAKE